MFAMDYSNRQNACLIYDYNTKISKDMFIRIMDHANYMKWFPVEKILGESWKNCTIGEFLSGTTMDYEFAYNIPVAHQEEMEYSPIPPWSD